MAMTKWVAAAAVATIAFTAIPTSAFGLYRCQALDAAELGLDGMVVRTGGTDALRDLFSVVIIDVEFATVRNTVSTQQWHLAQRGGANSDAVLVPLLADAAAAATDFIRVRIWSQPVTFLVFWLDGIVTGTCEPIG